MRFLVISFFILLPFLSFASELTQSPKNTLGFNSRWQKAGFERDLETKETAFLVSGSYARLISDHFQLQTEAQYYAIGSSDVSTLFVKVGPVLSFAATDARERFFVGVLGGFVRILSYSNSNTSFQYTVLAGKRFKMNDYLVWSPNITFTVPEHHKGFLALNVFALEVWF